MEKISELFSRYKIKNLFLKGPVIAFDIFGDISLRTSKDLDILIQTKDMKKVDELLRIVGYEKEPVNTLLNELKWRGHHICYFHPQKKVQIEIHWRLQRRPMTEPSFNKLWNRKRVVTKTNYPVFFLGKEDLFLYLISHGARHGWFRLRWLLDIKKMLDNELDFRKLNRHIKEYQNRHMIGQALLLTSKLFNNHINEKLMELTKNKKSEDLTCKSFSFLKGTESLTSITSTKYYKRYFLSLLTIPQRVLYFLILFYPSQKDSKVLGLPMSLNFLYFPLRPFLVGWRKLSASKFLISFLKIGKNKTSFDIATEKLKQLISCIFVKS